MNGKPAVVEEFTWRHWTETCLFWFITQVVWGFIPLLFTLFITVVIGLSENIEHEFRIAATVVAVTLCGTQFVDDVSIPEQHRWLWKWLRSLSLFILLFAAGVSVVNVLYEKQPPGINVSDNVANLSVLVVLALAVVLSLRAHILKEQARNEERLRTVEEAQAEVIERLSQEAAEHTMVGDTKI